VVVEVEEEIITLHVKDLDAGGSGIVILRARSSSIILSASPGTNTVTTQPCGQDVASFTVSGSLKLQVISNSISRLFSSSRWCRRWKLNMEVEVELEVIVLHFQVEQN
jgi:hypothetical protein